MEEKEIRWRLQGILAETIFELLHREMKCLVFKTGQESLYPTLLYLANNQKKLYQHLYKEDDLKDLSATYTFKIGANMDSIYDMPNGTPTMKDVSRIRYKKGKAGVALATSPDFTIITPSGNIEQVEVKFRADGILSKKELAKYLFHKPPPMIFIVMSKEPFIKILVPYVKLNDLLGKPKIQELREKISEIEKNFDGLDDLRRLWAIDDKFGELNYRELQSESCSIYGGPSDEDDESLIYMKTLKSECLLYPEELMKKYKKIIKEIFIF